MERIITSKKNTFFKIKLYSIAVIKYAIKWISNTSANKKNKIKIITTKPKKILADLSEIFPLAIGLILFFIEWFLSLSTSKISFKI